MLGRRRVVKSMVVMWCRFVRGRGAGGGGEGEGYGCLSGEGNLVFGSASFQFGRGRSRFVEGLVVMWAVGDIG